MNTLAHPQNTQSGAVLVISLILLLLLSLLGVSASINSGLEERMAGNSRDKNLAFQAAESALLAAEKSLRDFRSASAMPTFSSSGAYGYYLTAPTGDILSDGFWGAGPNVISYDGDLADINADSHPRYIIQDLGCVTPCPSPLPGDYPHNYRITAYATGGTTAAVAILQSIYRI